MPPEVLHMECFEKQKKKNHSQEAVNRNFSEQQFETTLTTL